MLGFRELLSQQFGAVSLAVDLNDAAICLMGNSVWLMPVQTTV